MGWCEPRFWGSGRSQNLVYDGFWHLRTENGGDWKKRGLVRLPGVQRTVQSPNGERQKWYGSKREIRVSMCICVWMQWKRKVKHTNSQTQLPWEKELTYHNDYENSLILIFWCCHWTRNYWCCRFLYASGARVCWVVQLCFCSKLLKGINVEEGTRSRRPLINLNSRTSFIVILDPHPGLDCLNCPEEFSRVQRV